MKPENYKLGYNDAIRELQHFSSAELLKDGVGGGGGGAYHEGWTDACNAATKPVGRPKGTTKPDSERRVSLTIKILPYVAENIKKLPRGHLRKLIENLYG